MGWDEEVCGSGHENPEREVSTGVDGDVGGLNAVDGVVVRFGFPVENVHETTVVSAVRAASNFGEGEEEGNEEASLPWKEGLESGRSRKKLVVGEKVKRFFWKGKSRLLHSISVLGRRIDEM